MGLDTVELVMEFEDEFEISIPDADAEKIQTIGETVDCIANLLTGRGFLSVSGCCGSAHTFYKVRRELMIEAGAARSSIRPDSLLEDLIAEGRGRAAWRDIARRCGLPRPRLNPLKPFSPRFPRSGTRLRHLIQRSSGSLFHCDGSVNRDVVMRRVKEVAARQAGVDIGDLKPSTNYITDLRMD